MKNGRNSLAKMIIAALDTRYAPISTNGTTST